MQVESTITPYVADMLVAAKDAGFEPPAQLLDRTLKRLEDDLLAGGNAHYDYEYSEHLRLAEMMHAGYVLARQKRAPLGTLRALYDNERSKLIAPLPLVHLGVALNLMGDSERGRKAIEEPFTREFKRPAWIGDYGTDLRDLALMVALTHEAGLAQPAYDAKVYAMAREITGRSVWDGKFYFSTQEQIVHLQRKLRAVGKVSTIGQAGKSAGLQSPANPRRKPAGMHGVPTKRANRRRTDRERFRTGPGQPPPLM